MINMQLIKNLLILLNLKTDQDNNEESLNILNNNEEVVGKIIFNDETSITALSDYGVLKAKYVRSDQKAPTYMLRFNCPDDFIEFELDNRISGKVAIDNEKKVTIWNLKLTKSNNTHLVVSINEGDTLFNFISFAKNGEEEFSITNSGKIIYTVSNGTFDQTIRSFPFLTTIVVSKCNDLEKTISADVLITDRNIPIYKNSKIYEYENLLKDELEALKQTNPDVLWRLEYVRDLIGDELFIKIASSSLKTITDEEFISLFERKRKAIPHDNRIYQNENRNNLKLVPLANLKRVINK